MSNKKLTIILVLLTLIGGYWRFVGITKNPPSLNIDEVAIGYNAYSILKTGRDEYGYFMPVSFKSVGDYKSPMPVYLMVPSIALFGLNEFGVRFPTAIIATLSIPLVFYLFLLLAKRQDVALLGSSLFALSPWGVYFSRYVSDSMIGLVVFCLGLVCFLKMCSGKAFWAVLAALFLALSMYSYHTEEAFVPIFLIFLLIYFRQRLWDFRKTTTTFLVAFAIFLIPLGLNIVFGQGGARAQMVFIGNDIDFTRYVTMDQHPFPSHPLQVFDSPQVLLIFFWFKRYLNYLTPNFLFLNGLNATSSNLYGLGVMYLFEVPFLILGIISLFKKSTPNKGLMIAWILFGLFPGSITNNEQSTVRTLIILPALILISALGGVVLIKFLLSLRNKMSKWVLSAGFLILFLISLIQGFLVLALHFPYERSEDFMAGTKETVEYALAHKDEYQEIVFDPYRGIAAPDIVSIPHMYILFYSQYDPATYQKETKRSGENFFSFNKFTIRKIDWRIDRAQKHTLFVGSPWDLPTQDLTQSRVLEKVYLNNHFLAFYVVDNDTK